MHARDGACEERVYCSVDDSIDVLTFELELWKTCGKL